MDVIVNTISINAKMKNALGTKKFQGLARTNANTRLVFAKGALLKDFDGHTVTKELLRPPNQDDAAGDKSELIKAEHGNLSSFIGFEDASIEIAKLRNFIDDKIELNSSPPRIEYNRHRVDYHFIVNTPSAIEFSETFSTPDNWSSRSWIDIVENGIGNIASYIFSAVGFSFGNSRSGFGLQMKDKKGKPRKKKNPGYFQPQSYITELFVNFRARFS